MLWIAVLGALLLEGAGGILAGLPLPPPSPFPCCRVPGGGRDPGPPRVFPRCPVDSLWKPLRGLQAAVARPLLELVTSGQRGAQLARPPGRRGRVCGGLWMRSRAGLAEPRPTSDLPWRGPRAWAEGQWRWPGARGQGLAQGSRAVGEARDLGVEGAVCGASSQPCQGGRSKAFLDAAGLVLIITLEMVLAFLLCILALWGLANPLLSELFFFFSFHSFDNVAPGIWDLSFLW